MAGGVNITFYPESDNPDFIEAARQYQAIWDEEGTRMVDTIETVSRLRFTETLVNAVVFEGVSHSHPLSLRASYSYDVKKATLIHELCHRLLVGNRIGVHDQADGARFVDEVQLHKEVDLILYDIWCNLYGEGFAKRQVEVEAARRPVYRHAFEWVLLQSREERARVFDELQQRGNG
jgi:hypothetical protein